jgi:tRNA pseudouridine(55) synthase
MFLAVDKPQWITSYDVIRRLKRQFPKKTKIGHSGTLDPMATGLLIIAVDKDTKRLHEFLGADKSYETTIDFSKMSDTWDMDYWEVYEEYPLRHCENEQSEDEAIQDKKKSPVISTEANVMSGMEKSRQQRDVLTTPQGHFLADTQGALDMTNRTSSGWRIGIIKNKTFTLAPSIEQIKAKLDTLIPSAILPLTPFSAKKKDGKKLYELARAGIEVNESREMRVNAYEIVDYNFPTLTLKLDVWSGTYIRSIGYWLGQEFGLGGILTSLRRTKVGKVDISTLILDQEVEEIRYVQIVV